MTIAQRLLASQRWLPVAVMLMMGLVMEVVALSGPNVCMVKQKYNITKRIKYRAPMSVRTYEWCFSMPPRCSRWNTEMRDLTRLETEERTAEVAVCCPGYKMKDVSCVPICPNGKTGSGCSEDCKPNKWGPNCVNECKDCSHGICSPFTGECICQEGWQGESCKTIISTSTTSTTPVENLLTTSTAATKTTRLYSTEPNLVTSSKTTVAITTSSTTKQTTTASTVLPSTQNTKTTAQLTTSTTKSLGNLSSTTIPTTLVRFSSTYDDVTSRPNNKHIVFKTKETENFNTKDVIYTSTVHTLGSPKSTYAKNVTNKKEDDFKKEEIKTTTTSTTEKTEVKISSEKAPTANTTRVFEITKSLSTKTTIIDTTRRPETTVKLFPTTLKFKPKEIWIRPAQKGEPPVTETKIKLTHELTHIKYKNLTKTDDLPNTTPKTIIVSIIPTSVSYATFKKIALTTASYVSLKNHSTIKINKPGEQSTRALFTQTSTVTPFKLSKENTVSSLLSNPTSSESSNGYKFTTNTPTSSRTSTSDFLSVNNTTNSMPRTPNVVSKSNSSNFLTTSSVSTTNTTLYPHRRNLVTERLATRTNTPVYSEANSTSSTAKTLKISTVEPVEVTKRNATKLLLDKAVEITSTNKSLSKNITNKVLKDSKTNAVTDKPAEDEEKFHILTEPEHITAVMSDKDTERSSVDLISVISIAGGVMMAVITVAVIIVMMERCRRPRYDDVRKINDIRMQVMIDSNDMPPPYVRSIFHTPLPEPPSDKCHYQPISTLDRNLKQFMRPVVVQTISPIMLENFRGILECHYDHLPRRSHDLDTMQKRSSEAPSVSACEQHLLHRVSLTESAIDALKCEAKLDVIDSTTSEPLYAEIPCWRPPSEHAIEVVNTNGEAITEL